MVGYDGRGVQRAGHDTFGGVSDQTYSVYLSHATTINTCWSLLKSLCDSKPISGLTSTPPPPFPKL